MTPYGFLWSRYASFHPWQRRWGVWEFPGEHRDQGRRDSNRQLWTHQTQHEQHVGYSYERVCWSGGVASSFILSFDLWCCCGSSQQVRQLLSGFRVSGIQPTHLWHHPWHPGARLPGYTRRHRGRRLLPVTSPLDHCSQHQSIVLWLTVSLCSFISPVFSSIKILFDRK